MNPDATALRLLNFAGTGTLAVAFSLLFYFNISFLKHQFEAMRQRYFMGMESSLEHLKYFMNTQKRMDSLNLISALVLGLMGMMLKIGIFGMVFGLAAGWFLPSILTGYVQKRRLQKLNTQFIQTLSLLANAMKAGESLTQAIESTKKIIGNPMAQELSIVSGQIRLGVPASRALKELSERVPLSDVKIATNAMLISMKTGADLPHALNQIADTMQNRVQVQGKIDALTAQGKAQGMVAGAAPFGLGALMYIVDPGYMDVLFTTFYGNLALAVVIVMQVVAFFVIRKIVSINI